MFFQVNLFENKLKQNVLKREINGYKVLFLNLWRNSSKISFWIVQSITVLPLAMVLMWSMQEGLDGVVNYQVVFVFDSLK